eukprot:g2004.t1
MHQHICVSFTHFFHWSKVKVRWVPPAPLEFEMCFDYNYDCAAQQVEQRKLFIYNQATQGAANKIWCQDCYVYLKIGFEFTLDIGARYPGWDWFKTWPLRAELEAQVTGETSTGFSYNRKITLWEEYNYERTRGRGCEAVGNGEELCKGKEWSGNGFQQHPFDYTIQGSARAKFSMIPFLTLMVKGGLDVVIAEIWGGLPFTFGFPITVGADADLLPAPIRLFGDTLGNDTIHGECWN